MTTQTAPVSGLFDQAIENLRKLAESNIEMQQEMFSKWNTNWPGIPQPQGVWLERAQRFQKAWSKTVKELAARHREVLDEQYDLAMSSLEEAFRLAQSSDPQECAKQYESLFRKSLAVMRETGELQLKELQEALSKWTELVGKSAT
jgi:tetratricopeptide (TPR) repeat protein